MRATPNHKFQIDNASEIDAQNYKKWTVKVRIGPDEQNPIIDWDQFLITENRKILAQRLLIRWWAPFELGQPNSIASDKFRWCDLLLRVLTILEKRHPEQKAHELSRDDWIQVAIEFLYSIWNPEIKSARSLLKRNTILGSATFTKFITVMNMWYESYLLGEISDGPDMKILSTDLDEILTVVLADHGETLSEWKAGGSRGSVDFVVAHLLLSDAIGAINSTKAKQLIEYFVAVRAVNSPNLIRAFWSDTGKTLLNQYRQEGKIEILTHTKEAERGEFVNDCKRYFAPLLHEGLKSVCPQGENFRFPWRNYRELIADYNEIQGAIYVIFLSVMGKRGPSEVRTLRGVDITLGDVAQGTGATFRPSISKTAKGLRTDQGVSNFIDQAFNLVLELGYLSKTGTDLPLFSTIGMLTNIEKVPKTNSVDQSHRILAMYYENFCKRIQKDIDFDIKLKHETIASHQFRHSFAEFALRRFDGYQVEEMIRMHFCHSFNHWWTKKYTSGKTDKDHETFLSRKYIRDLIPRILSNTDLDSDFVGGMAVYIKKQLLEQTKVLSPSEVEDQIKRFSNEFINITPHEYGWCMLNKNFQTVAKCSDEIGRPNPAATSSEKCNSCANFCASRYSHLSVQKQIAIAHIDFIEQSVWKMPSLKQSSKEAVVNAQKLFPELKELGVF